MNELSINFMPRKKLVQLISTALLLLGVILLIPGTDWHSKASTFAFVSVLVGTIGSIVSIFIPSNYTLYFECEDWIQSDEDSFLTVKASKHGQGTSPTVQVFIKNKDSYDEVGAGTAHDKDGNVTVSASRTFTMAGKLVIS